jgi:hypothetical protein
MLTNWLKRVSILFLLVLTLFVNTACTAPTQTSQLRNPSQTSQYASLEKGNTPVGQDFGSWVVQTGHGLIKDAFVRDNNKLGVVITPQVRPNEVKPFAKSLVEGFHHNFPNRDLTVLMYAPDKQLILTARYDQQSNQVQYQ